MAIAMTLMGSFAFMTVSDGCDSRHCEEAEEGACVHVCCAPSLGLQSHSSFIVHAAAERHSGFDVIVKTAPLGADIFRPPIA